MTETRRKFDQDFKDYAVRRVRETNKPIAQVARDLRINEGTLGNWVNADKRRHGEGNGAPPNTPFQVLSDVAANTHRHDYLSFARYADALAFLIDQTDTATPLIIAISAPWGAGKTTLANLVEEQLRESVAWNQQHIICTFNAWKHDDASNLGSAFAADVASYASRARHWWNRVLQPLPSPMLKPEQRWRRRLAIIAASIIIAVIIILFQHKDGVITAVMTPAQHKWTEAISYEVPGFASTIIFLFLIAFLAPKIYSGMRSLARFIDEPGAEAARGSIDLVREQLGKLIHKATRGRRRFVIFVDDLERCRPPRAVEICEVASQLLNHEDVVTVLVGDMHTIARSAAIKYKELEVPNSQQIDAGAYEEYGRAYLQKLVQIQFDLPPPASVQLKAMLRANRDQAYSKWRTTKGDSAGSAEHSTPSSQTSGLDAYKVGRLFSLVTTWLIVVLAYAFIIWLTDHSLSNSGLLDSAWFGLLLGVLPLVMAIGLITAQTWIGEARYRRRAKKNRDRIDEMAKKLNWRMTIDDAAAEVVAKSQEAEKISESDVLKRFFDGWLGQGTTSSKTKGRTSSSYIRKRIFYWWLRYLQRQEASKAIEELAYEFLPERPRAAKRLLNQVRLMMVIALSRDLFKRKLKQTGRKGKQTEEQQAVWLGKWLVLLERWPAVAEFMQQNQEKITILENTENLEATLSEQHIGGVDDIEDLRRLLSLPPSFGDIRELLLLGRIPASPL